MLFRTIQILWHNKEPVHSVDCEPGKNRSNTKVVTGGGDSSVRIWELNHRCTSKPLFEHVCSLDKHSGSVNCVRWHPQGSIIASGGDDGIIFLWKKVESIKEDTDKWIAAVTLRSSSPDVYDLSWSPDGLFIAAASTDNTVRIFDVRKRQCIYVLTDHFNFVQGVCFDITGGLLATQSSDQSVIVYSCSVKNGKLSRPKILANIKRFESPTNPINPELEKPNNYKPKVYYDESLTSFFRRLNFSPDGLLLVTPASLTFKQSSTNPGTSDQVNYQRLNRSLVYGRNSLKSRIPLLELPVPNCRPTVAVRFSPISYKLREDVEPLIPLPYRLIFAIACQDAIVVYDTQQRPPLVVATGLHYATITDIAWSDDGLILIITSIDGYCSVISFLRSDLGEEWEGKFILSPPEIHSVTDQLQTEAKRTKPSGISHKQRDTPSNVVRIIPTFIRPNS